MMRIRDYGYTIGKMKTGPLNKITDVKGISIGHHTVDEDNLKTGVSVIMPSEKNIYKNRYIAASHIINGFGKTTGLVQLEELGQLESPIALTGTLNVGKVHNAMVSHMANQIEGLITYNPIVAECNDSYLTDVLARPIGENEVFKAIDSATVDFEEGDVGA